MAVTEFVKASGVKLNQGTAPISQLKALTEFFNVGDGKVVTREWAAEVKALTPGDKADLCTMIADVTDWPINIDTANVAVA
jgi:hypothetical protein